MILTYKIKHSRDFSIELEKAKQVAVFGIEHSILSSKNVKQFGLKSMISNQILRKYVKNKNIKQVHSVNLIVPNQGIKVDRERNTIIIPCLKFSFQYRIPVFEKVNQIEINKNFIFVSVTILEKKQLKTNISIGVDLNTTGHIAVIANPQTGKVMKLGKKAGHIHLKYKNIRKKLQKKAKYKLVKAIKNRESRIIKDLNHKVSKRIVNEATAQRANLILEDLKGIRKTRKQAKSFKYSLHSWSFYQLGNMIEYKARLNGIQVFKIDPRYTSQQCSRCGLLGHRIKKHFKCPACGYVEHADVNAAFVLAERHQGIVRMPVERDIGIGSTDTPGEEMVANAN